MKQRLQRLSAFSTSSQPDGQIGAARTGGSGATADDGCDDAGSCACEDSSSGGHAWQQQECRAEVRQAESVAAAEATAAALDASNSLPSPPDTSDDEDKTEQAVEVAQGLMGRGATPLHAANVAAIAARSSHQEAVAEAAHTVGVGAWTVVPDAAADESAPAQQEAQRPQLDAWPQVPQRERQQQLERQWGQLSFDLEAQERPGQAARAAKDAASGPFPGSSVFRRCCPWLLPWLPWHRAQQKKRMSKAVQRSQSFSEK